MNCASCMLVSLIISASSNAMPTNFQSSFPEREFETKERKRLDDGVGGILAKFVPRVSEQTGIFPNEKIANSVGQWLSNVQIMQEVIKSEGFGGLMALFSSVMEGGGLSNLMSGTIDNADAGQPQESVKSERSDSNVVLSGKTANTNSDWSFQKDKGTETTHLSKRQPEVAPGWSKFQKSFSDPGPFKFKFSA